MSAPHCIGRFDGAYAFLSNFYYAQIIVQGRSYRTNEHCYQAYKATSEIDHERVRVLGTPGQAKRRGRYIQIRRDWEQIKDEVMFMCVQAKFDQHPHLASLLVATGDSLLVEGNSWGDTYWGVCKGKGQNKLGHILMQVRSTFK